MQREAIKKSLVYSASISITGHLKTTNVPPRNLAVRAAGMELPSKYHETVFDAPDNTACRRRTRQRYGRRWSNSPSVAKVVN